MRSRCRAAGGAPISRKDIGVIDPVQNSSKRGGSARPGRGGRDQTCRSPPAAPTAPRNRKRGANVELSYLGLFASAVLAATVLPGASELLMLGLLVQGLDSWVLWLVATLGNVAGSTLNWGLGRFAVRFADRRWFPVSGTALARAQGWFQRW